MDLSLNLAGYLLALIPASAEASFPQDVVTSYDLLFVGPVELSNQRRQVDLLVQSFSFELGVEDWGIGLVIREGRSLNEARPYRPETGVMLSGRFSPVLTDWLRLDASGLVGLTHGTTDPSQPNFATESVFRASAVVFDPVGLGPAQNRIFLSSHAGFEVNWTGRTQLVGGGGAWWRGLGLYGTAYWSANGVDGLSDDPNRFAFLDAAGLTASLSYDFEFETQALRVAIRQNVPLRNAGWDIGLNLQWSYDLSNPTSLEMAW